MDLRTKIILVLTSVLFLLGMLSFTFFIKFIRPTFLEIEERNALTDLSRVTYALHSEMNHLDSLTHDWAARNATYNFMQTVSDEYIEENLPVSSFTDNDLNLISFYGVNGKLIWSEARDLESEELINIKDFSGDRLPLNHHLLKFTLNKSPLSEVSIKGIWMTEHGPMLISSRPVVNNENEGPIRGALVMGRLLENNVLERLNKQVRVQFKVFSIKSDDSLPGYFLKVLQLLSPEKPYYLDRTGKEELKIFTSVTPLNKGSVLLVQANKKREIFKESQNVMNYAIVSILLSIVTAFVLLSVLLQKIVVGPLKSLTGHVLEIGRSGNLVSQLKVKTNDEVGLLAKEFNVMIVNLHESKHKLQEQSFQLGMAELASGIMHNLRNTLLILFGRIEKTRMTIDKIPVEKVTKARHELTKTTVDGERKESLIQFLDTTNESLLKFISRIKLQLDEIKLLGGETEYVLKSFEKWAYLGKGDENILLENLIRESYHFVQKEHRDKISLIVAMGPRGVNLFKVNRILLIQIFINLFANAAESIDKVKVEGGEILVDADVEETDSGHTVHIRICDNGVGMDRDVLQHIFERGFTTKRDGHTGMGLHWCFNAVSAMNGKLYAESSGSGKGACFHLVLPLITYE